MSIAPSIQSTAALSTSSRVERGDIFQDLPLIDRTSRLTVIELKHSDKQIINELVYRWCRILTRVSKKSLDKLAGPSDTSVKDIRKVLIIDLIGSINPVRLATVMKRDERRMRMIGIARGCKINSTFVTLSAYLDRQSNNNSLKLVVVYQDEFFIKRTLNLLRECISALKCQVLLVVPRLDRQEIDMLSLITDYHIIRCDFCVNRRDIGPAPPNSCADSYQAYLNQVYFQRHPSNKTLPDKVTGELREDGLYLHGIKVPAKSIKVTPTLDGPSMKRIRSEGEVSNL